MTDKELRHLRKYELIDMIYEMKKTEEELCNKLETSDIECQVCGTEEAGNAVIPSLEELEAERKRYLYKRTFRRTLRSTVAVLTVVAAVAVLIATLLMPVLQIHGSSMFPTLKNGQIVVSLKGNNYKTGDLVAFYYGNKLLIKRVVAGPGDWITVEKNGDVYVNGKVLDEPYVTEKSLGDCDQSFPLQIGDERWFLMGDNRTVSVDSRMAMIGTVSGEQIVGKIILRIWPLKRFGFAN